MSTNAHPEITFGRYEILAELGRGSMGVVYQARDPKIDRIVAIKTFTLNGEDDDETEFRERFIIEAQAAGRLSHPGIVTVYDVAEDPNNNTPYIVMEYVAGQTLKKLLTPSAPKFSLETTLRLAQEIAEALAYAHSQGVVHRDIKPANIIVSEDGHAKIMDFGVAKLDLSLRTQAGVLMGTPAYMSPEQLTGLPVDGRSDIFSLGVVLYTMLAGYRPFQGTGANTIGFKVVNSEPMPPTTLNPSLPGEVDRIVARAIAKDAESRYQNGKVMAADLARLREKLKAEREGSPEVHVPGMAPVATRAEKDPSSTRSSKNGEQRSSTHDLVAALIVPNSRISRNNTVPVSVAALNWLTAKKVELAAGLAAVMLLGLVTLLAQRHKTAAPSALSASASTPSDTQVLAQAPAPVASKRADTAMSRESNDDDVVVWHRKSGHSKSVEKAAPAPAIYTVSASPAVAPTVVNSADPAPEIVPPASKPATPPVADTSLRIDVEHPFSSGQLSLWLDGKLKYSESLHGEVKKRLIVFHKTEGHDIKKIEVPSGKHSIRIRVQSRERSYDLSKTISATLSAKNPQTLNVHCDKDELKLSFE